VPVPRLTALWPSDRDRGLHFRTTVGPHTAIVGRISPQAIERIDGLRAAYVTTQTAGDATIVVEDGAGNRIWRVRSRSGERLEIGGINDHIADARILAYPHSAGGHVLVWAYVMFWVDKLTLVDRIGRLADDDE